MSAAFAKSPGLTAAYRFDVRIRRSYDELMKPDRFASAGLFFGALLIFTWHMAPGLTAEDSGNFLMGARHLGTVHPPGYPLYVLLAFLFGKVPFGEFAARVNFMSAFFAAAAVTGTYWAVRIWLQAAIPVAGIAAAAVGLHYLFWSQAGIAEVYALNGFLLSLLLVLVGRFTNRESRATLFLTAFVFGLGLANHYPLMILSATPLILLPRLRRAAFNNFAGVLAALIAGLLPYTLLIINATVRRPEYSFGKLSSLDMVITHLLRTQYSGVDQAGGAFADKLEILFSSFQSLTTGFGVLAPAFFIGLIAVRRPTASALRVLGLCLLASWVLLALLLGFPADDRHIAIFQAYLVPAVILSGVFIAKGLQTLQSVWSSRVKVKPTWFYAGIAALMALTLPFNMKRATHRGDTLVANWARNLLTSIQPGAHVILCGTDVFAVYYTQLVEGLRPDLKLYDQFSIFTKENLYGDKLLFQRDDPIEFRHRQEAALARSGERPVYYLCSDSPVEAGLKADPLPYAFKIGGLEASPLRPEDEALLQEAARPANTKEYWLKLRRQVIFSQFINHFGKTSDDVSLDKTLSALKASDLFLDNEFIYKVANNLALNLRYQPSTEVFAALDARGFKLRVEDYSNVCGMFLIARKVAEAKVFCDKGLAKDSSCHKGLRQNAARLAQLMGDDETSRRLLNECR